MIKKVIFTLIILLLIIAFYSLGKQIFESMQAGKRLEQETEALVSLRKKNSELKKRLTEVGSVGFIEQQARDKLNLVRPGETIVIIPRGEIEKILGAEIEKGVENLPNWQGWLRLFWK